jgi:hypothetical protein
MLAEIFMMRLEAERRLSQEPSSASRLISIGPKSQLACKKADNAGAEAPSEELPVRLVR